MIDYNLGQSLNNAIYQLGSKFKKPKNIYPEAVQNPGYIPYQAPQPAMGTGTFNGQNISIPQFNFDPMKAQFDIQARSRLAEDQYNQAREDMRRRLAIAKFNLEQARKGTPNEEVQLGQWGEAASGEGRRRPGQIPYFRPTDAYNQELENIQNQMSSAADQYNKSGLGLKDDASAYSGMAKIQADRDAEQRNLQDKQMYYLAASMGSKEAQRARDAETKAETELKMKSAFLKSELRRLNEELKQAKKPVKPPKPSVNDFLNMDPKKRAEIIKIITARTGQDAMKKDIPPTPEEIQQRIFQMGLDFNQIAPYVNIKKKAEASSPYSKIRITDPGYENIPLSNIIQNKQAPLPTSTPQAPEVNNYKPTKKDNEVYSELKKQPTKEARLKVLKLYENKLKQDGINIEWVENQIRLQGN